MAYVDGIIAPNDILVKRFFEKMEKFLSKIIGQHQNDQQRYSEERQVSKFFGDTLRKEMGKYLDGIKNMKI